ncbi:FmdE family protein [Geobacter sp.]|uniref:FmdE family protein n=1 Tax=Geobacter sp. TaxID=46610 RepID=UPI002607345C|nr:FmdE family protein [Geobacter sp.]
MPINYCKILPCVAFAGVMSLAVSWSSALAAGAQPASTLYSQLETFHGHVCAGSIFGARLGLAAKEALKEAGGTGKFTARYYDLSCPVDGIQVGAGTTYGNAALVVEDRDEHRLILTADGNKRQVEARLTKKAEELGLRSRDLGKKARALPEGSPERRRLEQEIEEIYGWLRTAPTAEVVTVVHVSRR